MWLEAWIFAIFLCYYNCWGLLISVEPDIDVKFNALSLIGCGQS